MDSGRTVTLEAVLAAREARAARQRALLKEYPGATLVSYTLNVPGPVKRLSTGDRAFAAGLGALKRALARAQIGVRFAQRRMLDTGCEAFLVLDAPAARLKDVACALEETLPYGRLLDIDVISAAGPVSRSALGRTPRGCMVCGREGADCASRRLHPLPEVLAAFDRLAALAPEEE